LTLGHIIIVLSVAVLPRIIIAISGPTKSGNYGNIMLMIPPLLNHIIYILRFVEFWDMIKPNSLSLFIRWLCRDSDMGTSWVTKCSVFMIFLRRKMIITKGKNNWIIFIPWNKSYGIFIPVQQQNLIIALAKCGIRN
jgi:hypothetical protein